MSAKERSGDTGKFVNKKLNLFSAKYFHKILYHQTTTNQTKINELKIILCYKYDLIRQSKGNINLGDLRIMFGYLFEKNEFTVNAKTLFAKERVGGTGKFVEKKLTLDINLSFS